MSIDQRLQRQINHHDRTGIRPRPTQRATNLLLEDLRRSPGDNLRARRDRINRQREARMVARVDATAPTPAQEDDERFDADFGVLNY